MRTAAIIVAAGRGTRAGGGLPKQWQDLRGKSVIAHSFAAFQRAENVGEIVVVLHPDDTDLWAQTGLHADHIVHGGATRDASVRAGLAALSSNPPDYVLIHDAARPLVSQTIINNVINSLETHTGAAPALLVTDALWHGANNAVTGTQDRDGLFRAQTPQGFHFQTILSAHDALQIPASDDVAAARAAGHDIAIVPGEETNIKITSSSDFTLVNNLLGGDMDVRCGNGYDVHRFGEGDHVWLCGIRVPHTRSLQGHSDADVGLHAVTDAIYGALGMGDIGQHFPPSDPQWKGTASHIFLSHACALARNHGFTISNADCTLVCEHPKIGPHASDMKEKIANIMGIDHTRVSVKATTSERLGFTGRSEGIAAFATVTLVKS